MSSLSDRIRLLLNSLRGIFSHIDEDVFLEIVGIFEQEGVFSEDFFYILRNLVRADSMPVIRAMTPRVDMKYVRDDTTVEEVLQIFRKYAYTKYPVLEKDSGDFIGILYIKDVFMRLIRGLEEGEYADILEITAKKLAKPAEFIPFNFTILEAIKILRDKKIPIALVVDEFGVVIGMVTMEDLVEEIVGDIRQSYQEHLYRRIEDESNAIAYQVDARISIDEFIQFLKREFGISVSEEIGEDVNTLAGLILKELGRLPESGERIKIKALEGVDIVVSDVDKKRIKSVILRKPMDEKTGG